MGLAPWLDEDDMVAGSSLHREILKGFKESCAVIFFISANFKDEKFLGIVDKRVYESLRTVYLKNLEFFKPIHQMCP